MTESPNYEIAVTMNGETDSPSPQRPSLGELAEAVNNGDLRREIDEALEWDPELEVSSFGAITASPSLPDPQSSPPLHATSLAARQAGEMRPVDRRGVVRDPRGYETDPPPDRDDGYAEKPISRPTGRPFL